MKALLIKMSSLGDLFHTMPAITDAWRNHPDLELDWVVEEDFAAACRWHPAVRKTIPAAFRRWRRQLKSTRFTSAIGQIRQFRRTIAREQYDIVIDAQGLYKSAVVCLAAHGRKVGFSRQSLREKLAALAYRDRVNVPLQIGIIDRNRRLFAAAFGYSPPANEPDFAIQSADFVPSGIDRPYVLFNHAASWPTKSWPADKWRALASLAGDRNLTVCLPWYTQAEHRIADEIAAGFAHIRLIQTDLNVMAGLIQGAEAVISVETGFAHLAAALGRPTVTLYGPSGTRRHATCGPLKTQLVSSIDCSPCYARRCALLDGAPGLAPCMSELDSRQVWNAACQLMADGQGTNRSQQPVIDPAKA